MNIRLLTRTIPIPNDVEKGNAQLPDMIRALNEASQLISGGPQIAVVQES